MFPVPLASLDAREICSEISQAGISQLVGRENIYIFGESSEQVIKHYEKADYCAKDFYDKDERIRRAVDFIVGNELLSIGSEEHLRRLHHEIEARTGS